MQTTGEPTSFFYPRGRKSLWFSIWVQKVYFWQALNLSISLCCCHSWVCFQVSRV